MKLKAMVKKARGEKKKGLEISEESVNTPKIEDNEAEQAAEQAEKGGEERGENLHSESKSGSDPEMNSKVSKVTPQMWLMGLGVLSVGVFLYIRYSQKK